MSITNFMPQCLRGVSYYVHAQVVGTILHAIPSANVTPSIVISIQDSSLTSEDVGHLISHFAAVDDVYSPDFKESVVIQSTDLWNIENLQSKLQASKLFDSIHIAIVGTTRELLPSGPYFLHGDRIHQAWRLYEDELDAFVVTVIPENAQSPSKYRVLDAISPNGIWRQIAVPSRLYNPPSDSRPLGGMRISIKDNYKLAGIQMTMMNRAYTECYGPDVESASVLEKLQVLGAVVVGKTKMSSFAGADEPTDQWIDFLCPTNPRGDKYQSPSGSSTGAAAALAGYPWLDFSLGTDTVGSIRAPATCNGLYALRSSHGSISMAGIVPACRFYDVVGLYSRDLQSLLKFAARTLDLRATEKFPTKILYPLDYFPHSNPEQQRMVDEYVSILEKFLGTKKVVFSIAERWTQCPPAEAAGRSLKEFLSTSGFILLAYEMYHETDDFRDKYKSQFHKDPYVSAIIRFRWEHGEKFTKQDLDEALQQQYVFREWFSQNVLQAHRDSLSDAIMIMPNGRALPKYRDEPNGPPTKSNTLSENFLASVLQLPHLVLPIGQNAYTSRISGNLEHRPIVGSMVGAKGSDLMLINLARAAFESASWPTQVQTGRYAFEIGDNSRNTKDWTPKSPSNQTLGRL